MTTPIIAAIVLISIALAGCGKSEPTAEDRARARLAQIEAENAALEAEDKHNAPFDAALDIASLTDYDRAKLCGDGYLKVAIGWPIKKAMVCSGRRDWYVASEAAGGIRVWQSCWSNGQCLTVGEQRGYVVSWNGF